MKGDGCGFLHKFDPERMPVCRVWMKAGGWCVGAGCVVAVCVEDKSSA